MKFRINTVFLLSLLFKGAEAGKVLEVKDAIPGEYIVVLKPQGSSSSKGQSSFGVSDVGGVESYVNSVASSILSDSDVGFGVETIASYSKSVQGFTVRGANDKDAKIIARNPNVDYVEPNQRVKVSTTWGIDRVDQRDMPLDDSFSVPETGEGVYAYILDTGVQIAHDEFEGRATWGINTSGDNDDRDCHGHGTHVAGTVGGKEYGVAKKVNIVAVKVLQCSGSGSTSGVIAGVEWTMANAQGKKATANMSLGGGFSSSLNEAVRNLHNSGVPTVVAAGNDNGDACSKSPASEPDVITVGSTTDTDQRSSFSNYGECLDIFAPGSGITAAWIGSNDQLNTISGTSMASPHVCGGAALLLEAGVDAANVASELVSRATDDKVGGAQTGSPNKLLYVGAIGPTPAPTPAPPTQSPTACILDKVFVEVTTDNYPAETSWVLTNLCTGEKAGEGGGYSSAGTTYNDEVCVPDAKYEFVISDSYGDGICCSYGSGGYKVTYKEVDYTGAQFAASETKTFGSCDGTDPPVEPTDPPVEPTDPPVEPTDPPVEPTDPPVEPTDPPVEPTDPPVEPTDPPVEPTDPPVEPTDPPVEPTDPPVEPTDPPVEPTDPPVEPTDPPVEPTDPPVEPTDPPVEPTDPPVEPTDPPVEPTDPPVEPTDPPVEPTDPPVEPTDPPVEPTDPPVDPPVESPFESPVTSPTTEDDEWEEFDSSDFEDETTGFFLERFASRITDEHGYDDSNFSVVMRNRQKFMSEKISEMEEISTVKIKFHYYGNEHSESGEYSLKLQYKLKGVRGWKDGGDYVPTADTWNTGDFVFEKDPSIKWMKIRFVSKQARKSRIFIDNVQILIQ